MLRRRRQLLTTEADAKRFVLDRSCLEDDAPLRCEVGRVVEALERVVALVTLSASFPC